MTDRRRVLYVQPNSEVGGSDIALLRTIRAMATTGQHSIVVLPGDGPLVESLREAGAEVIFLPMRQLRTLPSPRYQLGYLAALWPTVRALRRIIEEKKPDLVHSNSAYCLYGAFAARRAGVPHLWHVREMAPQVPVATGAYAAMLRRLSTILLAMSEPCLSALYKTAPEQSRVMPDALDAPAFRAPMRHGRVRGELGLAETVPVVGFAARLDPWKGCPVFLDAAKRVAERHPAAMFVIAGGAPQGLEAHEQELHDQARELGIGDRVLFLGWRYQLADMADVMSSFDIFCHTSIQAEPFGLVLLEAMAVGTPVIAADAGGPRDIVREGETGYLTPPGDAEALASAICRLLDDRQAAKEMGEAARTRVENVFSVPVFVDRLSALYDECVSRAGQRSKAA